MSDLGEAPPDRRRRYVAGTEHFHMLHPAFQPFSHCGKIDAQLYRIEESIRKLAHFSAGPVPIIEELGHSEPKPFFPMKKADIAASHAWGNPSRRLRHWRLHQMKLALTAIQSQRWQGKMMLTS